jgi:hypothetical protein
MYDGTTKLNTRSNGIEVAKTGTDSYIHFPAQTNDAGYIRHYESGNVARMFFSVSDDNNTTDYFGFGYSGNQDRFRIYANGQWDSQGNGIVNGNLTANQFIDRNDNSYYADFAGTTRLNTLYAGILYDKDNSSFFVNPSTVTKLQKLTLNAGGTDIYMDPTLGKGQSDDSLFDMTRILDAKSTYSWADGSIVYGVPTGEFINTDTPFPGGVAIRSNTNRNIYSNYIPVEEGEELYGEIWARHIEGDDNATILYYGIERYDKDKRPITSNNGTTYFVAGGARNIGTSWKKYSNYHTLPTSHTPYNGSDGGAVKYVRVRILLNYSATGPTREYGGIMLKRTRVKHSKWFTQLGVGSSNNKSFDFYNNGTTYLNGATTVDSTLQVNGNTTVDGDLTLESTHKIVIGPNQGWNKRLIIGNNGNNSTSDAASIGTTDGNLHIDAAQGGYKTLLNFYDGTGGVHFGNGNAGTVAVMGPDGDLWKGSSDNSGHKYWHAGNDGAGSGLDADTVDGLHASSFLQLSGGTMTGALTVDTDIIVGDQIIHRYDGDTYMQFHADNQWRVVTGGAERLEVNNSAVTIQNALNVNGTLNMGGNRLTGNNFDITGVNAITINDPGEGIIWAAGSSGNITLATIDDSADNILNLSGTGASLAVNGAKVATESFVTSRGYITADDQTISWNNNGALTISEGNSVNLPIRVYTNVDYVPSGDANQRGNYGVGVTVYEGYNVGTNRPHTYDTTAQFMSTTSQGFELSVDWVSNSTTPLKIRSLRNCCQGWSPWRDVAVAEDGLSGTFYFNDSIHVGSRITHAGDTDTYIQFDANRIRLISGGTTKFDSNNTYNTVIGTDSDINTSGSTIIDNIYVTDGVITSMGTRTLTAADLGIAKPAPPVVNATNIVGETIEVVFEPSPEPNIDYYQVWSSVAGGSYGMIAQVPKSDFAATMTVIDDSFTVSGTISYRVYAVRHGIYSDPATASKAFATPTLDVINMSVVNLNTAYYIQYDLPDSKFVDHVEIYMDVEAVNTNLNRTGATLVYSGSNTNYMYQIGASDLDKYHQFWVEVIES